MKKITNNNNRIARFIAMIAIITSVSIHLGFAMGNEEQKDTYVFATDSTWPPMEYINEDKELVGFDIDIARAIADEVGITIDFVTTAWDGIFAGLVNGEYDAIISSVTITEERKKTMDFSDSYFNAGQILAIRSADAGSIQSIEDMVGKAVGAQIGTSGADVISGVSGLILKTYDDLGPAVEELANGTIDGIVADTPLVAEYLLRNPKYGELFTVVGEQLTTEEYGIVFSKGSELREKINAGLATIKQNGTYETIYNAWIE